jgi:subtilisin-like proprotein convertase family protein
MTRTSVLRLLASLAALGAGSAFAIDNPEIEPNNSKAAATLCASGGLGMDAGDTISGSCTGSSSTAGATSADYFLVKTKARPLGIYRYRLAFTSATSGHTISIRGLTQTAGVVNPGTDAGIQTHSTTIIPGARTIQWYGFGRQEQIYVKVIGTSTSTAPYVGTLSVDTVTPGTVSGTVVDGTVTIREDASTPATADTDFIVYNSSFNPVAGYMNDNPDTQGLTREFVAGTYYVAWGLFNTCNDQPSPADDANRTGSVTDFPNVVVNTSALSVTNHTMLVHTDAGDALGSFDRSSAFDINFVRLDMAVNTIALPPTCAASITPTSILNDGTGTYTITVNVTPGRRPASTAHTVTADLSLLGDPRPQPVVLTQTSPGVYSTTGTVADGTPASPYGITINTQETAPLSRSCTCQVNLTITSPPVGACCTNDGCFSLTQRNCVNQGGVYQGNGTVCTGCMCASTVPPANNSCDTAQLLRVGDSISGNTCAAAPQTVPTCGGIPSNAGGLWYKFVGTGNAVTIDTCLSPAATRFNSRISVFCGGCGSLTCVGGNDTGNCGNLQASLTVCTQNNAEYLVLVHNNGAGGDFVLTTTDGGVSCTPNVLCIPTGGCCLSNGCQDVTQAECTALGGTFLGLGHPCVTHTQNAAFSSTDTPVAIPDLSFGDAHITIGPGHGTINNLAVSIGLTHTYLNDLIATLSNGTSTVTLFSREGGAVNLAGTYVFADSGAIRISATGLTGTNDVVPSDTYLPLTPMSGLNGVPYEGTWTLHISDNAGIDVGSIDSFQFVSITEISNCNGGGCPACAADYNQDGGVDGGDLAAFFPDWQNSATCADVNQDGGIDGGDLEAFFVVWQAGGC